MKNEELYRRLRFYLILNGRMNYILSCYVTGMVFFVAGMLGLYLKFWVLGFGFIVGTFAFIIMSIINAFKTRRYIDTYNEQIKKLWGERDPYGRKIKECD